MEIKLGYPEMERLLLTAFKERRNEGRAVSALWLKMKGREIVQQVYGETDFKASRGGCSILSNGTIYHFEGKQTTRRNLLKLNWELP